MESQPTAQSVRDRPRALVLASSADVAANDLCVDLLSSDSPERQRVLSLSYTRRPTRIVDHWRAAHDGLPASMAIVCPESHADGEPPDGVHTTHVPASDLTGASIAVSRYLDRWDGDEPITVCLNSLTSLLQYADRDRVFRFLHTITSRCLAHKKENQRQRHRSHNSQDTPHAYLPTPEARIITADHAHAPPPDWCPGTIAVG